MITLIVIQNKNGAKYLPTVINSVLAQTNKNYILVGIDAGSTDNSVALYKTYSQYMDWIDCTGLNQAESCNKIIKTYWDYDWTHFMWINCDDWFCPDSIEKHFAVFEDDLDLDIVCSGVFVFYEDKPKLGIKISINAENPEDIYSAWEKGRNIISQPSVMINKKIFEKIGFFDENIIYPFDYAFWVKAYNHGAKFGVITLPTAWRRKKNDCFTNTKTKEIRKEMAIIHELYKIGGKK